MIKLIPTECRVTVLENSTHPDIVANAWISSRPTINIKDVRTDDILSIDAPIKDVRTDDILSIDAPIGDMPSLVIKFRTPVLFREMMVGLRDHVMWARSSRVDNLLKEWQVMPGIEGQLDHLVGEMEHSAKHDKQDAFRQHMPLGYVTEYVMRMGARTAVKVVLAFYAIHSDPLVGERVRSEASTLASSLRDALINAGLPFWRMAVKLKPAKLLHPLRDGRYMQRVVHTSEIITVRRSMPVSLRAQLARHRSLVIADGLSGLIQNELAPIMPIGVVIPVEVAGTHDDWRAISSQRNCWIAQSELWQPLLNDVNEIIGNPALPCDGGKCPFTGDCIQRLKKEDPNPPCPRQLHLDRNDLGIQNLFAENWSFGEFRDAAMDYAYISKRDEVYWKSQIDALEEGE